MRTDRTQYRSSNAFQGVPHGPEAFARYRVAFGDLMLPATGWRDALDVASVITGADRDRIEADGAWVDDGLFVGGFGDGEFTIEEDEF